MDSKKLLIAICAVLAVVTVSFGVLTGVNMLNSKETAVIEPEHEFSVEGQVDYDCLAAPLAAIMTDNQRQAQYPDGILEKLKNAYAVNDDLIGWLSIPGSEIDTAVTVSDDNNYYLKRDFYEVYTTSDDVNYGNLYLDYRSYSNTLSKNTVIYGHTTDKPAGYLGQAFRELHNYKDKNYLAAHPIIEYSTLYGSYKFKVCAVFRTNAKAADDNGYVFNYIYPHMSDSNMVGYIEQVQQRNLFDTGVSLEPTDKIITLSTCVYDYGKINTRLVIVGRLLHEGESEAIDVAAVRERADYRMPDAWCVSRGISNPYKNSNGWKPSPN